MKTLPIAQIRQMLAERIEQTGNLESRLEAWLEGTRGENSPEEEKADKERLIYLAGYRNGLEQFSAILERFTE